MLNMLDPNKKKIASVIVAGMGEPEGEGDHTTALNHAAHKLILAVEGKDANGVVDAFQTMFDICESMPHEENEEGETEEESY